MQRLSTNDRDFEVRFGAILADGRDTTTRVERRSCGASTSAAAPTRCTPVALNPLRSAVTDALRT